MSRYIDADAIIEFIDIGHYRNPLELCYSEQYVVDMIESRPTADVVEVVRCKDCYWFIVNETKADGTTDKRYKPTWCTYHNGYMNDDDFCSYGERREDEQIH